VSRIDIIEALNDPKLLGPVLGRHPETWDTWKVFLKAVFGLPMDGRELETFQKHTGRSEPPKGRSEEVFAVVGRRGGKSFVTSLITSYIVLFEDFWTTDLAPGEKVVFPIIATDRLQARVIFNYIQGILNSNGLFKDQVVQQKIEEIELKNNVSISIRTPSFRGVRGPKYIGAALDELAFWRDQETFANPADEIIKAIRPAIVDGGILFGISSAYNRAGVFYDEYSENFGRVDTDTLIWHAGTLDMNPTFKERKIKKAVNKDAAHARAEYYSEWRDDLSSLFSSATIENNMVSGRQELRPIKGIKYFAFCDPSGGRHDSFTLAIGHKSNSGKKVVDLLREVKPGQAGFAPSEVVREFCNTVKGYGVREITADKYGAAWVQEAFRKEGIQLVYSELTASDLYLNMLPDLSNNSVELLDSKRLKVELMGLMRKTMPGGRDKVVPAPGMDSHADLANAVAGVIHMLRDEQRALIGVLGYRRRESIFD